MASNIRRAEIKDLDAILEIYNEAVLNTTATFDIVPRTKEQQYAWFKEHDNRFVIIVHEQNGGITGWASLSRWSDRLAYNDTSEDSIYVKKDFRKRGIGRQLLAELLEIADAAGFHTIIARIAEGNKTSIKMHEELGFEIIGVMREAGKKFGRLIDVTLMQRMM